MSAMPSEPEGSDPGPLQAKTNEEAVSKPATPRQQSKPTTPGLSRPSMPIAQTETFLQDQAKHKWLWEWLTDLGVRRPELNTPTSALARGFVTLQQLKTLLRSLPEDEVIAFNKLADHELQLAVGTHEIQEDPLQVKLRAYLEKYRRFSHQGPREPSEDGEDITHWAMLDNPTPGYQWLLDEHDKKWQAAVVIQAAWRRWNKRCVEDGRPAHCMARDLRRAQADLRLAYERATRKDRDAKKRYKPWVGFKDGLMDKYKSLMMAEALIKKIEARDLKLLQPDVQPDVQEDAELEALQQIIANFPKESDTPEPPEPPADAAAAHKPRHRASEPMGLKPRASESGQQAHSSDCSPAESPKAAGLHQGYRHSFSGACDSSKMKTMSRKSSRFFQTQTTNLQSEASGASSSGMSVDFALESYRSRPHEEEGPRDPSRSKSQGRIHRSLTNGTLDSCPSPLLGGRTPVGPIAVQMLHKPAPPANLKPNPVAFKYSRLGSDHRLADNQPPDDDDDDDGGQEDDGWPGPKLAAANQCGREGCLGGAQGVLHDPIADQGVASATPRQTPPAQYFPQAPPVPISTPGTRISSNRVSEPSFTVPAGSIQHVPMPPPARPPLNALMGFRSTQSESNGPAAPSTGALTSNGGVPSISAFPRSGDWGAISLLPIRTSAAGLSPLRASDPALCLRSTLNLDQNLRQQPSSAFSPLSGAASPVTGRGVGALLPVLPGAFKKSSMASPREIPTDSSLAMSMIEPDSIRVHPLKWPGQLRGLSNPTSCPGSPMAPPRAPGFAALQQAAQLQLISQQGQHSPLQKRTSQDRIVVPRRSLNGPIPPLPQQARVSAAGDGPAMDSMMNLLAAQKALRSSVALPALGKKALVPFATLEPRESVA